MALAIINGMFQGAYIKDREFNDKKETYVQIDVYQPESQSNNKTISIKCEDIKLFDKLQKEYSFGSVISLECMINAFKNQAYFKLSKLLG